LSRFQRKKRGENAVLIFEFSVEKKGLGWALSKRRFGQEKKMKMALQAEIWVQEATCNSTSWDCLCRVTVFLYRVIHLTMALGLRLGWLICCS
jgi:hypothetical protein